MKRKKRLVVLTGAGMSAESGISTFRDSNGLWENHRIEDVATPEGFDLNPQLVLDFYNQRRRQLFTVTPNDGHRELVRLEELFDVQIITQNVDNLHEQAGSRNVMHLHGELTKVCPVDDKETTYELNAEKPDINVGDTDDRGIQLRPFIVWFGESVPLIEEAIKVVEKSDILVVIGTSLNVYPAANLINYARSGQPIFLIDPNPVKAHRSDIRVIAEGASSGTKQLRKELEQHNL